MRQHGTPRVQRRSPFPRKGGCGNRNNELNKQPSLPTEGAANDLWWSPSHSGKDCEDADARHNARIRPTTGIASLSRARHKRDEHTT